MGLSTSCNGLLSHPIIIIVQPTHFRKTETTRNHTHQNVLVTWTQVKTLDKQQTSPVKTILKPIRNVKVLYV
jgi:hypothetical protein